MRGDSKLSQQLTWLLMLVTTIATSSLLRERRKEIGEISPTSVTLGGVVLDDNEEKFAAAHAVDKDLSTAAAADTAYGAGWIKLMFDKTHFIHKVVIYYWFYTNWYDPSGGCIQSVEIFKGCVDTDNNVDVSVYQGEVLQKSCGTLQLTYGLEQSDQIYTLLCNTDGDTVKLTKSTGNLLAYEIAITSTGPCSAGTYRSTDQTSCVPCEEGTVSTETEATSCTSCDLGKEANSDKTKCEPCSAGTHRPADKTSCEKCVGNTISTEGADSCTPCKPGYQANTQNTQCDPCSAGTYRSTDQTSCVPCEEGTVSTETEATSCTSCDLGKEANSDKTQCEPCSAGTHRPADKTSCEKCVGNTISTEGADSCTPCKPGYQANTQNTQCDPCQAGKYRDNQMWECRPCPSGTISTEGAGLCTDCPQRSLASEDQTKCESCEGLPESWKHITTERQFPLPPGSEVSLKCSTGHTLTGDTTVTCTDGTVFSFTEAPLCVLDECSQLPDISNLVTETQLPVSYNIPVTVKCVSGYSLEGSDVITCIKEKNYRSIDGNLPACNEKVCNGLPPDISNLATEQTFPVSYNTAVTVRCSGDSELRGDNIITCNQGTDFKFSVKPKCNEMGTCTELPQESHLWTDSVLPVKKGTVLVVDCVRGYTLTAGERVLTCVQDAEYTVWRHFPSCTVDKCRELPDIWSIKTDTQLPVNHGTQVELECIPGYSLSGSNVITCVRDRNWEYGTVPECILDTCTELPAAVSHMTTTTSFPVIVGTVVEVKCQPGYTQAGDSTITCIEGVSFTIGQRPTCTIDTCTGMMIENFLSTNASYPITYGTIVTVACDPQYDLLGSDVITCEEGIVYSHSSRRPKCVSKDILINYISAD
ncbi:hypothetical protein ACHWQZ_G010058 [Mnemiopsis leidyi]